MYMYMYVGNLKEFELDENSSYMYNKRIWIKWTTLYNI